MQLVLYLNVFLWSRASEYLITSISFKLFRFVTWQPCWYPSIVCFRETEIGDMSKWYGWMSILKIETNGSQVKVHWRAKWRSWVHIPYSSHKLSMLSLLLIVVNKIIDLLAHLGWLLDHCPDCRHVLDDDPSNL